MAKILVTGASGLLGQHLCRQLLARGYEVRGLVRPSSLPCELPDSVEKMSGDIRDAARVREAVRGCEGVIHACCTHVYNLPREDVYAVNVTGTLHICDAARQSGSRLVFTSTISTFKRQSGSADDPALVPARQWNTVTKAKAEEAVLQAAGDGVAAMIVNPSFFVGPFDYNPSPFRLWIPLGIRRRIRFVPQGGFNVVHAADVAEAHIWALEHGIPGQRYPMVGYNVSLADYAAAVNEAAGHPHVPRVLPKSLLTGIARGRVFDEYAARLVNGLNFLTVDSSTPVATRSLQAIIAETVSWFATNRRLVDLFALARYVRERYI
jgi:dihydroflavonol-4-reductase